MEKARRLPPVWMMGMTNASFGLTGGFCAVVIPDMLSAHGIPAGEIATIASLILSPGFWAFAIAPILDVHLSRRTYALFFGSFTAVAVALSLNFSSQPHIVEALMVPGFLAANLYQGAVGGWMGSLISKQQDSELGVWFTVSNLGAGGLMMVLAGELLHRFNAPVVGIMLGVLVLLPMLFFLAIPSVSPDACLARDSFKRFWTEVAALVRQRHVIFALLLFVMPAASFTLTNVLGGAGADFSASEREVSLLAGIGSSIAGLVGSFLLFPLARRLALRPLYLGIGAAGALFTLSLILLPRRPWSFGVAITGENLFQALAFSAGNAITFEVIGPDNPLAATLFTLLLSAENLPIVYMQYLDGRGYSHGGLTGSYLTDACVSVSACSLLGWMLSRWRTVKETGGPVLEVLSEHGE
jgi:PAT family beta-lactamase induction signal transducer AmpG